MKKNEAYLFLSTMLIGAAYIPFEGTYWWATWGVKWFTLLALITFWISYKIYKETHWTAGAMFFWVMISGVSIFATKGGIYEGSGLFDLVIYKNATFYTTFSFFMISVFFLLHLDQLDLYENLIAWLCLADIGATLATYIYGGFDRLALGGFFGNPSVNICFLIASLPIFLFTWKKGRLFSFWQSQGSD